MGGLPADAAEEIAAIAALNVNEDSADDVLRRVVVLVTNRLPNCVAAALTVDGPEEGLTFAASSEAIDPIHRLQFQRHVGPVVETLEYGEARRIDDIETERRWPMLVAAMKEVGFASCLVLPIRTDRSCGALALYGDAGGAFRASALDLGLLLAAQTGVALHNVDVYQQACRSIENLERALSTRAAIEQAKAIIALEQNVSPEDAFHILARESQNRGRKLAELARDLVRRRFTDG